MNKTRWIGIALLTISLALIVTFHGIYNLKEIIEPPSTVWGRDTLISSSDFKKELQFKNKGENAEIVYIGSTGFERAIIDKAGKNIEKENVIIDGLNLNKLVNYKVGNKNIYWTESYDLYAANMNNDNKGLKKSKLLTDIIDFEVIDFHGSDYVLALERHGVAIYKLNADGVLQKLSRYEASIENADQVAGAIKNDGMLHVVFTDEVSSIEYNLYYLKYDFNQNKWLSIAKPFVIENFSTSREGSNSINNLQIGLNEKTAYIAYEIGKYSSQGVTAKTYISKIELNNKANQKELNFEPFVIEGLGGPKDNYFSSLKFLNSNNGKIDAIVLTQPQNSDEESGNELFFVKMEQGRVIEKQLATKGAIWKINAEVIKFGNDYGACYIQVGGEASYEIKYTSTNNEYRINNNKVWGRDVKEALMKAIPPYFYGIYIGIFRVIIFLPILLLPLAADFFEWKVFRRKPNLVFNVGVLICQLPILYNYKLIYNHSNWVDKMPLAIKFGFGMYCIIVLTSLIPYFLVRLIRRKEMEMGMVLDLALYIIINTLLVYMLYSPYMASF